MPTYRFFCKKCDLEFSEMCMYSDKKKVGCPKCGKKKLSELVTGPSAVIFKEKKGTSREDNFEYVAQWNAEQNQNLRRAAESANKHGDPYKHIDDSKYEGKII